MSRITSWFLKVFVENPKQIPPVLPTFPLPLPSAQWMHFSAVGRLWLGLACLTVVTIHVLETGWREDISCSNCNFKQQINSLWWIFTGVELKSGSNQQPLSIRNSSTTTTKNPFKRSWSLLVVGIGFRYLIPWG